MVKQNEQFLTKISERLGRDTGAIYTAWHDENSIKLSYRWLEENNYDITVVLDSKYQNNLSIYLLEEFIKWCKENLNEGK